MIMLINPSSYLPSFGNEVCSHCKYYVVISCRFRMCADYCTGYLCHPTKISPTVIIDSE